MAPCQLGPEPVWGQFSRCALHYGLTWRVEGERISMCYLVLALAGDCERDGLGWDHFCETLRQIARAGPVPRRFDQPWVVGLQCKELFQDDHWSVKWCVTHDDQWDACQMRAILKNKAVKIAREAQASNRGWPWFYEQIRELFADLDVKRHGGTPAPGHPAP